MDLVGQELRGIKLIRPVGSGGMGTVYQARVARSRRDLPAGKEVAVKVLHPHLVLEPEIRSRFKREAGLGMTLRHPGVVRIFHVDSQRVGESLVLFLVMEYLRGITLKSMLDESGSLSDQTLRQVTVQVADALSVIHARGIVHRDLKPENIFIEKGGVVKIGDFGLSQLSEKSRQSEQQGFIGSVAYAAPERFGPERAKPPSDLYSLGVVLYELATCVNPFLGDGLTSTIANHHDMVPSSPSDSGALISPFMSALIMALLEKDPRRRLGPPARLKRILEKAESSQWWKSAKSEDLAGLISRRRAAICIARKTGFFGRTAEVGKLLDLLEEVESQRQGRVALIRGEAGVGKTRLLDRLLEKMDQAGRKGRLLVVQALQSNVPVPYHTLIAAVLTALDLRETDRRVLRDDLVKKLADLFQGRNQIAEDFATFLVSRRPGEGETAIPPDAAAYLFTDFFKLLAADSMLILVVENIHGADPMTLGVLLRMARRIRKSPILIVLTARSGEADSGRESSTAVADDFLGRICKEEDVAILVLDRLSRSEVKKILVDYGFPTLVAEGEVGDRVFEVTEGNPYFVLEVAGLLLKEGALNAANPDWFGLLRHVPASIQDVFYRRLFRLSPEERQFLDFASVFGIRFSVDDVIGALELDFARAAGIVSKLQNTLSLIRPTLDGRHRFDHVLLREMIYDNLDPDAKQAFHKRVGNYFEKLAAERPLTGREALKAAVHFSRGGDSLSFLRRFSQAFDYLLYKSAYGSAMKLARDAALEVRKLQAEGHAFTPFEDCGVLLKLARVAHIVGRRDVEVEVLRKALRAAHDEPSLRAAVCLRFATHDYAKSRYFGALSWVESALDQMIRAGDRAGEAEALQLHADIMRNIDRAFDVTPYLERALKIRKELDDEAGQARILIKIGMNKLDRGEPGAARSHFREAMPFLRRTGGAEAKGTMLLGISRLQMEKGRPDLAERTLRHAIETARRLGQGFLKARILGDLGECLLERKKMTEAVSVLKEARRLAVETGSDKIVARVLAALARTHAAADEKADAAALARDAAREAVQRARDADLGDADMINALNALAFVFLARGKQRSALAITRKTGRLLKKGAFRKRLEQETLRLHVAATS